MGSGATNGEEGRTTTLGNEVRVFRQCAEDPDPVRLAIAERDWKPDGIVSGQHTWNGLIANFVAAVREGDLKHETVPHLPHISDGLAAQEIIHACEQSHRDRRWVSV